MEGSTALVPGAPEQLALNDREKYAFKRHIEKKDPPLSPHLAVKLFELFLAGKTCEDIRRLNDHFTLGQIVHARLEHEWDRRYQEHLDGLYNGARARLQQVTLETSLALADILAAKNKVYRDRVLKFLQTGDEEHIKDLGLGGIDGYRKLVETLQKLTGQEQVKTVRGEITHTHTSAPATLAIPSDRAPSAQQAENIVDALLGGDGEP